jgi:hypothetical protein
MKKGFTQYRETVLKRCGGYCEKCGSPLGETWALHHRKLRSRGGEDCVTNFVALHHECHNMGTDSVHFNPRKAENAGLMVASWQSPNDVPLTLPSGDIVLLTDDGSYRYLERKENGW